MHPVYQSHPEVLLGLVIAGSGRYLVDESSYGLAPGTLIWLLPNQAYRFDPEPGLKMWVLTLLPDPSYQDLLDEISRYQCRNIAHDDALSLDRLFSRVSQDADQPRLQRAGLDYALRSACHIGASGVETIGERLHPAVITAVRLLRDWPDVPNAAALASRCGVSQDYLRELLVKQTGRGFVEWRNRSRLERFQSLHAKSGDLLRSALAAGFGSYTQFHRVFVDIVGRTPGDWVKDGGRSNQISSLIDTMPEPSRASARMIWYPLSEIIFTAAARWIGSDFAAFFEAGAGDDPAPVLSSVEGGFSLRRFEGELRNDILQSAPSTVTLLDHAFAQGDIFSEYEKWLSYFDYHLDDLAPLIASHLAFGWAFLRGSNSGSRDAADHGVERVRRALNASGSFAEASPADRRLAMAAICAQAHFSRSAQLAAAASGRADIIGRVATAVQQTLLGTYGWNASHSALDLNS